MPKGKRFARKRPINGTRENTSETPAVKPRKGANPIRSAGERVFDLARGRAIYWGHATRGYP